ncbi:MAG TPA: class I SAM-dependent methyltransferase [Polyangiaceae bacterium]
MRSGTPSLTASIVALGRGLADDPVAERLLPAPLRIAHRVLRQASARAAWAGPLTNVLMGGLVEHMRWRTAAIDHCLNEAIVSGIEQVVILGAGLDARAYRMKALARAVVFEIDHPSTQAYKRSRTAGLSPTARTVHFTALDFERDALADALEQAGHHTDLPTLWIWEGVTPYLARGAIRATLEQIAARSAPGSRLAMTYVPPELTAVRVSPRLIHFSFRVLGEPLRGLMTSREAAAELSNAGFGVLHDRSSAERTRQVWTLPFTALLTERLVIAERTA